MTAVNPQAARPRLRYNYTFLAADMQRAYDEWGANCGPGALAFALQRPIDAVRELVPGFDGKRYTSPTMMRGALARLGRRFYDRPLDGLLPNERIPAMFATTIALVRIQWCGPWTEPGANPRWAYRQTHWVACWLDHRGQHGAAGPRPAYVFDINGGIMQFHAWTTRVVPKLLALYPRSNGQWFPTHVWRLNG